MTTVTKIIAIRHGETDWNLATRIQGHTDIELNEKGRWQAKRVSAALSPEPLAAIYASDLLRAWDTAQAISVVKKENVVAAPGLRERNFGVFEGHTHTEISELWPKDNDLWLSRDPSWAPENGESLNDFYLRVTNTVKTLSAQHLGQQIVVVAHGGVLDMLYRACTGERVNAKRTWDLGNASINKILWSPAGFNLVEWSDTQHLVEISSDEYTT